MDGPIEDPYFNWLCAKVLDARESNYHELMRILYRTDFVWIVPNDDNRYQDGLELREDFSRETGMSGDNEWWASPCSILEMLYAFARRASFQTDDPPRHWFWIFLRNLRLDAYRKVDNSDRATIDEILYTLVWRTYDPLGYGGMFPLRNSNNDQRKVEIWYQFCEYLEDQGLL